jgi:putative ABC transport system permease protein
MFFSSSKAQMTAEAVRGVPVDWQVQLAPGVAASSAIKTIAAAQGVRTALPVGYADLTSFEATTGGTVQTTGAGKALGLPPGYATTFPGEMRYLIGARDGVLLAQQTAANLQVQVGDAITIHGPGGTLATVTIAGVVDLPQADSLFQTVGAPPGSGVTAPPDNVVLLPLAQWHRLFDAQAAARPDTVHTQIHVTLGRGLPPDPSLAYTEVVSRAHNLEAHMTGAAVVGNNLAAQLGAARADAIYSELLFLFLGLPGVVLAWFIAAVAGAAGRDRRRREQALLRVRGASPAAILRPAAA